MVSFIVWKFPKPIRVLRVSYSDWIPIRFPALYYQPTADKSLYVLDNHSHFIDLDEKWFDDPQNCVDDVAHSLAEKFKKAFPMRE